MAQRIMLPNGSWVEFPDGMSLQQIDAEIQSMDQRTIVPERGNTRALADIGVDAAAGVAGFVPTAIDALQLDETVEGNGRGRVRELFGETAANVFDYTPAGIVDKGVTRARELMGSGAKAAAGAIDTAREFGGAGLKAAMTATNTGGIADALRGTGEVAEGDLPERRQQENDRRVAAGLPTLEEESKGKITSQIADAARSNIDEGKRQIKSDYSAAIDTEMGKALDGGLASTVGFVADSPGEALSAISGSAISYLAPGMLLGKVGRGLGLADEAATAMNVQGTSALAATQGAEGAANAVMQASAEQKAKIPEYQQMLAKNYTDEQATLVLAGKAYDAALLPGVAIGAATGAASQALGLTPVEEILARGGRAGQGRIAGAVSGALKETPGEGLQGGGEQLAQNFGEVAGGVRDEADTFKGVASGAFLEAFAGAGMGAGVGFVAPQRVAAEVTARPTDPADPAGQAASDFAEIYAAAKSGGFDAAPVAPTAPPAAPGVVSLMSDPDPTQPPVSTPAPATPIVGSPAAAPAATTAPASAGVPTELAPGQDPLDALAGVEPVVREGATPRDREAFAAFEAARTGAPPAGEPGADTPQSRARPLPPIATAPRPLGAADLVAPSTKGTGYAQGVKRLVPGEEAKPYLKANIDTLPDPTPEQLPTDSSARYFDAAKGDAVVPLSLLRPTKVERVAGNALKRMAATAAGVIARRDAIDVRLMEDGTYEIVDGNGSFAAAEQLGLKDMPVRIVEAPKGKEGWRLSRGMLTPEADAALTAAYEVAADTLPAYTETVTGLAQRLGGTPQIASLKGRTRAEEKVSKDYKGDSSKLLDMLRGTIVFETEAAALEAMAEIVGSMKIVRNKDGLSPGTNDKGFGYRDVNIVVEMPGGTKAEIQLMTREMAEAKKAGHKFYGVTRKIQPKLEDGTATASEKMRYDRAAAKQVKIYTAASPRALATPASSSSRVMGDQDLNGLVGSSTSSPDATRGSPATLNRMPVAALPGENTTTANNSSSRSKNNTPSPAGGTATPSNTSSIADSPSVDRDIVPETPAKRGAIDRAIDALLSKLGIDRGKVVVLRKFTDLPKGVPRRNLDGRTEGIYHDGTVYLFTDALTDPARAIWVVAHEFAGHLGLRALLPQAQLGKILQEAGSNLTIRGIARSMKAEAEAEMEEGAEGARDLPLSGFIEEALAEMAAATLTGDFDALIERYGDGIAAERADAAETKKAQGIANRLGAAVKKFFYSGASPMSDKDVAALLRNAYKAAQSAAPATGGGVAQSRPLVGDRTDVSKLPDGSGASAEVFTMGQALDLAKSRKWAKGRDLKLAIQEEARARQDSAGVDLREMNKTSFRVLVDAVVSEAKEAIKAHTNAIGWYDKKVSQALAAISLVHPEIAKYKENRVAFIWALAVTSNGQKVKKNFELASDVYSRWKRDGVMPTDIKAGNAQGAINSGLGLFNGLSKRMTPEQIEKFLVTKFTVGEIARAIGEKPGGEAIDTPVRGAAIAGPKVGNGFLSNLLGHFDQLTVDRWFMRTWGRMTGNLVAVDQDAVKARRRQLAVAVNSMTAGQRAEMRELVGDLLRSTDEEVDSLAARIQKATADKAKREAMQSSAKTDDMRKAGNGLMGSLDGSIEAPSGPEQREWIRAVFGEALETLQKERPDLTMADLQAVLWYPEKKLYDTAKTKDEQQGEDVYADDEAPDYANVAREMAVAAGIPLADVEAAMRDYESSADNAPQEMTPAEKARFLKTVTAPPEQMQQFVFEVAPDPADAEVMELWGQLTAKAKEKLTKEIGAETAATIAEIMGLPGIAKPVTASGGYAGQINPNQIAAFPVTKVSLPQAKAFAAAVGLALDQASVVLVDARLAESNEAIRVVTPKSAKASLESIWAAITAGIPELAGEGFTARGNALEFLHWTGIPGADLSSRVQYLLEDAGIEAAVSFGDIKSTLVERKSYDSEIEALRPGLREDLDSAIADLRARTKQRFAEAVQGEATAGPATRNRTGAARRGSGGEPEAEAVAPAQSRAARRNDPADLDEDQIFDLLSEYGLNVNDRLDAEKSWTDGDLVFVNNEMAQGDPYLAESLQQIRNSAPDNLMVVRAIDFDAFSEDDTAMQSRALPPRQDMGDATPKVAVGYDMKNDDGLKVAFPRGRLQVTVKEKNWTGEEDVVGAFVLEDRYTEEDDVMYLTDLQALFRSPGGGGKALRTALAYADRNALRLRLEPKAFGKNPALTTPQLTAWYERYGFERIGRKNLWERAAASDIFEPMQSRAPVPAVPGKPTPLYVSRDVTSDGGLRQWAIDAGLTDVLPLSEMHVTVTYSRAPVDVADVPAQGGRLSARGGGRAIQLRSALAMPLRAAALQAGNQRYIGAGASHDYGDGYKPHVTIKYDATDDEVALLQVAAPFNGLMEFGPEKQELLVPGDDAPVEAPAQSRAPTSPEFRRWFGDSKVINSKGKPLRVFHGTAKSFEVFGGQYQYFTDDRFVAEEYARDASGDVLIEAYLSIKNPKVFDGAPTRDELSNAISEGHDGAIFNGRLERDGYGVPLDDGVENGMVYITFRPEQIKSAIGNNGNFDASNPNITQSRATTQAARARAAALRQQKSQLARELTSQFVTATQVKAWLGRARILIGEVSVSPEFAQDLAEARRMLTPERRDALSGDRAALKRYDEIRDMMAGVDANQKIVRAKAAEANRLLDKAERRTASMSLAEREALVVQLSESLEAAEAAYIAAKRIADWRAGNDGKVIKAHQKRNDTLGFLAAQGYQQGSFLWNGAGSLKDQAESKRRAIRRHMQDKMIDLRDVQEEIERQLGRSLDDLQNVYRAENQMHGKVADGIDSFRQRMVDPLKAAIKASGLSIPEVEKYLWARHATERNAKIRSINPGVNDGSGMTDAEAAAQLATYAPEQLAKLEAIGRRVNTIRLHSLETLVKAGQLDRAQADAIINSYTHYVPLRAKNEGEERVGGTGQGISASGSGIQRALGRKTPPKNILAELIGDGERAIVQSGKAEVGRALLRLVLSYPNPELWSVEPVVLEPKFNEATGEVYLAIGKVDDAESVIVKHNGKPYRVQIKHPRLVAALRNTGTEGAEWIVKYLGKVNRWLSAVFTRFNPGFVPVNLMRDLLQGVTGVAAELGAGSTAAVLNNYLPAMRSTYLDSRSQRGDSSVADADKTMTDWTREFAEAGGKTGWTAIDDMDTLQADIENATMSIMAVAKTRPLDAIGEAFSRNIVIQTIEHANDAVENALRVATYAHLRKDKGWSKAKAADYAKEMTVNFNRKGASGSVINALYLFYNAGIQGSRRTLMLMRHPKVQAVLGSLMAGQAILAMTIGMIKADDDDEMTLWEQIPDHVKRRSFVIPLGFDDQGNPRWVSIPMPFGFNIFPALGGYAANYGSDGWRGKQESHVASAVGYMSSVVIDAMSPIAVGEEGGLWPTVVGMGMDLARNRDDLGRRIGQSEDFTTYETPRASMAKPGTPAPFVIAANLMNRIGGGDDYHKPTILPGLLDVSANDLEFLFNQFAGGPGTTITSFYRAAVREAGTGDAKAFELPVVRAVVGGARAESVEARRFYDNKDRIERNLDRLKDGFVEGGAPRFEEIQSDLGPAYADIELKTRKTTTKHGAAGEVMADNGTGRPELVAPDGSALDTYRDADRALKGISSEMRRVFNDQTQTPVERSRRLIELQRERAEAATALNRLMSRADAARG